MQKIDIKEIPTSPGIYIFKDEYEEPLYVGKAKNLRKRVPSYFREKSSWKIKRLVAESKDLSFVVSKNRLKRHYSRTLLTYQMSSNW